MKNKVLLSAAVAAFTMSTALAQKVAPGYTINGTIAGKDTGTVYLTPDNDQKQVDSVRLKKGKFVFKGTLSSPMVVWIGLSGSQQRAGLFAENSAISFTAHKDSLSKAVVKGSATDVEYKDYLGQWDQIFQRAGKFYRRSDSLNKAFKGKVDSVNKASLDKEYADLEVYAFDIQDRFIKAHAQSPLGAYVIYVRYIAYNIWNKVNELYPVLGPAAQSSYYGVKIKEAKDMDAKTGIGARPVFTQTDTAGKAVQLADFKGKYVLVDFWASWCGPCRKENPNVVAAYHKYHDKGFEVLGISLDSNKDLWLNAIHKDGLTWTHVSDLKGWQNAVALEYGVKLVPTSLLIDKEGKVIGKNLRGEELQKKLESLLGNQ